MTSRRYVIVVAEDDPLINQLLSELLVEEGYNVHCCFNGVEASRVIERVVPDLAIVDLQMETKDAGLVLLKAVRENPQTARLAVLVCSADMVFLEQYSSDLQQLHAEVMPKPFELDRLVERIQAMLVTKP